ncbi:MAG: Coenzyme F420 hydrogenase/dehydrogenase, beta subunit C-terminal domain [Muribaculaceae bacterium]|nr:Coenzyme F420 hydrogenase/dehydrogenase, beta subunit C-terminal domain [Muribaculaceae bacterium]
MEYQYKSIQRVSDSYLCSNCGACQVVCPKDAIGFKVTSIGRVYADVNDSCIDCGLCQNVCPSLNDTMPSLDKENLLGKITSLRVGKATDEVIYKNAQSGGICTALLKYLFDSGKIDGALVCRMEYAAPVPKVKAVIVKNTEELSSIQKSCYTPVQLLGLLKREFPKYTSLAIVGLGCHIEGLTGIEQLNKKYAEKIFCKIGLICDRSLCGTIQDVYATYVKASGAVKINWRCKNTEDGQKHYSYRNAPLVIHNRNGKSKELPNKYRFVLKDMFTSPRCRICPDKLNLCSDITLGDPWLMSDIDWENGASVVIGRTEKGEQILSDAIREGYMVLSPRPLEELIKGQVVKQRKKQISTYKQAFSVLHPTIDSYLLTSSLIVEKNEEGLNYTKKAEEDLKGFVNREKLSKEEIIRLARKEIRMSRIRGTLIYRGLRKIYRMIKL